MTGLYPRSTPLCGVFCQVKVCFIQLLSSRSGKSSLACAPRDSFLLAAAVAVCVLQNKLAGSRQPLPDDQYVRASQQVSQLECLDQIRVPNHAPVLDADVLERLVDVVDFLDALV